MAILADLAVGQWGMFTTAQAALAGVERMQLTRLAGTGVLERVGQGVYAMSHTIDEHRDLHEAWLSFDPKATAEERIHMRIEAAVASHTSAAALHGMGDLDPSVPELTTPKRKQTSRRVKLHRLPLDPDEVTLVDGLPTTTPERTILDLLRGGHDQSHVATAIRDGLHAGILDMGKLAGQLNRVTGRLDASDGENLMLGLLDMVHPNGTSAV
ncbi:type IV toxin-antitoxin system AbiEi family antitoxin domain-containing protein [Arthrobacter sp. JSM 101049]|uniref:type IV toxin-antitoxin system AbiEi family antitoxin domain-containing protein n=1 Tax=Arthrobacter sp. JSM 101049 TaxID=929097 RepID=UPI00356521F7